MEPQETEEKKEGITLSSGKKAVVRDGIGLDSKYATRDAEGKQEDYMPNLMARLTEIDGHPVVPEDLLNLPLKDYTAIQNEVAKTNF